MQRQLETVFDSPALRRSTHDELLNAATHAIGFLLAVVGALVMAAAVSADGDPRRVIGCGVYLASLVTVYAMSTLSHSARSPLWKSRFRRLDQGFIYLLIVATFTPFAIAYLQGAWLLLLVAMWAVALAGFVAKVFYAHRVEAVSLGSYIVLGWLPVIAAPELVRVMPAAALWWMLAGGLCYTIGTVFLHYDEHVRHFHAVWHVSVIAGSACHFVGILLFAV